MNKLHKQLLNRIADAINEWEKENEKLGQVACCVEIPLRGIGTECSVYLLSDDGKFKGDE